MKNKNNNSGSGFSGLLQVAFIVLKLCGVINWSWWWVLSPLWISLGVVVVAIVVALIVHWFRNRKKADAGRNPVRCNECLFAYDYENGFLNCDFNKCMVKDCDSCNKGVRR